MSDIRREYVPIPSIGHELGVMFGFLGAMALSLLIYVLVWQHGNRTDRKREIQRLEALRAQGWLREKYDDAGSETVHEEIAL